MPKVRDSKRTKKPLPRAKKPAAKAKKPLAKVAKPLAKAKKPSVKAAKPKPQARTPAKEKTPRKAGARTKAKAGPSPRDRKLTLACAEAIRKFHPTAEVILYGSRARGKAESDSDMDLLVLTERKLSLREEMIVIDAVYPIEVESGVIICPIVEERDRWYSNKYQVMPIAIAITKDGVKL